MEQRVLKTRVWKIGSVLGLCLMAVAAFVARPTMTRAQNGVARSCHEMNYSNVGHHAPQDMTYDVEKGVVLRMRKGASQMYSAVVAKDLNGEPNPDFDRMYALLLRALPTQGVTEICVKGDIAAGGELALVAAKVIPQGAGSGTNPGSGTVQFPAVQKVQLCDGARCARVSDLGYVFTTN